MVRNSKCRKHVLPPPTHPSTHRIQHLTNNPKTPWSRIYTAASSICPGFVGIYAHSFTPDIAMAGKVQICQKIRCGRLDKHRTRRMDADGRPDCMGRHGQCGLPRRGKPKSCVMRNFMSYVMRNFRVATRLRSKVSPDRVTYVSKLTSVDPGTRIRLSLPETRTRDMDPSALAANHQNARASGALPQARPVLCPPPPSPPSPSSSQDALRPDASMFQIICEYIDKEKTKDHMDEGERHGLKATAFRLSVSVSSHKACQSAFPTISNEAVLTPSCVTRRRSLALAVLLTALDISNLGLQFVTPEMLARAIESDMTIRKMARNAQHSIVNFLYRNNALLESQGGHGP